jgi:hypothetical protein
MRFSVWPGYQRLLRGCGLMPVLLFAAYMMTPAPALALTQAQIQQAAANMTPDQIQQAAANLSPEQKAKLASMLGAGGGVTGQALPGQTMAPPQNLSADEQAALAQPPAPLPP